MEHDRAELLTHDTRHPPQLRSRSRIAIRLGFMFEPMSSREHARAKALTQRDVVDLIRAGLILALTIAAAIAVPPQVFGG